MIVDDWDCRADHDDQDVVMFNRCMLPAYYGLLRMCCQLSKSFTRQLALHQNIQWAFKNITPFYAQYTAVSTCRSALYYMLLCFMVIICYRQGSHSQKHSHSTFNDMMCLIMVTLCSSYINYVTEIKYHSNAAVNGGKGAKSQTAQNLNAPPKIFLGIQTGNA